MYVIQIVLQVAARVDVSVAAIVSSTLYFKGVSFHCIRVSNHLYSESYHQKIQLLSCRCRSKIILMLGRGHQGCVTLKNISPPLKFLCWYSPDYALADRRGLKKCCYFFLPSWYTRIRGGVLKIAPRRIMVAESGSGRFAEICACRKYASALATTENSIRRNNSTSQTTAIEWTQKLTLVRCRSLLTTQRV